MRSLLFAAFLLVLILSVSSVYAAVDLLTAIDNGLVVAEFRGAGGAAVTGIVERQTPEPLDVVVEPGTYFYAQFGGGFGGGYGGGFRGGAGGGRGIGQRGGGAQGMSTFGATPIDLKTTQVAYVRVPTCCTDFGLREPGPGDVLVPGPPRTPQIAQVAAVAAHQNAEPAVAQLAVWAVANNIPKWAAERYVKSVSVGHPSEEQIKQRTGELIAQASELVKKAELDLTRYRLFK
jgi:hypothetical protein